MTIQSRFGLVFLAACLIPACSGPGGDSLGPYRQHHFTLVSPPDGAVGVPLAPTYSWNSAPSATSYTLQVSTSPAFASFAVNQAGIVGTSATPTGTLAYSTLYYWRVLAAGPAPATAGPSSFTTAGRPVIDLFPTTLSFTAAVGASAPPTQGVSLSNLTGASPPLNWVAVSDAPWLQVFPLSGTLGSGTTGLTISVTDTQAEAWTTTTSLTGAPAGREDFAMVWTGKEILVWGGTTAFGGVWTNGGARYDPSTDTWTGTISTVGAPTARRGHRGVWTGKEMIIWGGADASNFLNDGYRYDPQTDTWSGPISTVGVPTGRFSASAVWTGSEMIVWGGQNASYLNDGGVYDPVADTWSSTTTTGAPTGRWVAAAAWTGTEMVVFGGQDAGGLRNDGGRYYPSANTWGTPPTLTGAPAPVDGASAVFDGSEMIVWGGYPGSSAATTAGGRYNPGLDSWTATTLTGAPTAVRSHEAVWAGTEMIVWGGYDGGAFRNSGKRYVPPISLTPGVYKGTVRVMDPRAANSPQTIDVTFTVTP